MTLCTEETSVLAPMKPWLASGAQLCEATLRDTMSVLERAWALLGIDAINHPEILSGDFDALDNAIEMALISVKARLRCAAGDAYSTHADLVEQLVALSEMQARLRTAQTDLCTAAYAKAQKALCGLSMVSTVEQLIHRVPREVCRLGFDRALISKVHESIWTLQACHVEGDPSWSEQILLAGKKEPLYLTHAVLETEMVRRKGPMLVPKAGGDRGEALVATVMPRSYVAAPIMPEGKVIGFLHADRYLQRRHVNETDRDLLWAFAQGLGHIFQRVTLTQRQRLLRREIGRLTTETTRRLDGLLNAGVSVERIEEETPQGQQPCAFGSTDRTVLTDDALAGSGLTRRELEVIRLMAAGETNATIGRHLTISEGTTKSHVKRILRKLGAANRAEAVSLCLRMEGFSN